MQRVDILVCQADSCKRAAAEAVQLEIEELAKSVRSCQLRVLATGCLGACSEAPNALILKSGREVLHSRLTEVERSVRLLGQATGQQIHCEDPVVVQRLTEARKMRLRLEASKSCKWNAALCGMEAFINSTSGRQRVQLQLEYAKLLESAGNCVSALQHLDQVIAEAPQVPHLLVRRASLLGKLGRLEEIEAVQRKISLLFSDPEDFREELEYSSAIAKIKADAQKGGGVRIEGYAQWCLEKVTPMSKHSALYQFSSSDRMRGTPNPRGRGRTKWNKTWHVTFLAEIGPNLEGPLPWVERDYTPISTAADWENGRCDIVMKIYDDGLATKWLSKQPLGTKFWLSEPKLTLYVPSLVPQLDDNKLGSPNSVLLLLAGTGLVVGSQLLQHVNAALKCPVSLVYACRRDDFLGHDIAQSLEMGKLQRALVLVSPPTTSSASVAFPEGPSGEVQLAHPKARVHEGRLSEDLLRDELAVLTTWSPTRVVVSGPASFNAFASNLLSVCGVAKEAVTILSA